MKVQMNCNCKLEQEMVEYTKIEEQDRKQEHLYPSFVGQFVMLYHLTRSTMQQVTAPF